MSVKFPTELGLFELDSFSRDEGMFFNEIDKNYLIINKQFKEQGATLYSVSFQTECNKEDIFLDFCSEDLYNESLDFDVFVLKSDLVEINCNIVSDISTSYKGNKVQFSFTIVENYEL